MAQYNVDSAQVAQASATVKNISEQIRTDVATMMMTLQQLGSSWTGSASSAFQECSTQWRGAQAQVEASLDSIAAALSQAASTYEEAESHTTAMFAQH